jgi:hypothetical protein
MTFLRSRKGDIVFPGVKPSLFIYGAREMDSVKG